MNDALRQQILRQAQGATQLNLAFFGVATGLFDVLDEPLDTATLAERAGRDAAYVARWADAAFAFELLDRDGGRWSLTELGRAFRRDTPGGMMPMAVMGVIGAHMAERAATFSATGERPGEGVLGERESVLPLFGPMLEASFGPMFEGEVVDAVPAFARLAEQGGLAVDLGCGNGWYLRRLARKHPSVHGIGLDAFEENVAQAKRAAEAEGLSDRLTFQTGDLHHFAVDEKASLIAMNRALHHVWEQGEEVFHILADHLADDGTVVIWEPAWPADRATLRSHPRFRAMAFQNLSEHVQGNHFLQPEEIAEALSAVGLEPTIHRLMDGLEAVIEGRKRV